MVATVCFFIFPSDKMHFQKTKKKNKEKTTAKVTETKVKDAI